MPFGSDEVVRLDFSYQVLNQLAINTYWYKVRTASTISSVALAQSWWDYVKAAWRNAQTQSTNFTNSNVKCTGMNVGGDLGTFPIPAAEQTGLRLPANTEMAPSFVAATLNLNVATRLTRPGSKRVGGLTELDINQNLLVNTYVTVISQFAILLDDVISIVTPPTILDPVVVKRKVPMVPPFTTQPITSVATNLTTKSQVSRRLGN